MNNPKVSIVIPAYNASDYLAEAIDSALNQTYPNIEIIVINDGSNDNGATESVALSYGDRIRYFSKTNGGVATALNLGISQMEGEYFSWLSHDDLYTRDKVETQIRALSVCGNKDTVIYSDYSVFTADPDKCTPVRLKGVPPGQFRFWITVENRLHGCTLLIPRAAFTRCGVFDAELRTTQDYDLWFRMAKEYSFVHIPEQLVKARSHAEQGSHKMAPLAAKECNELLSKFILGLSTEEIVGATSKSLAESYSIIASSMFKRNFNIAGAVAERLEAQTSGYSRVLLPMKNTRRSIKTRMFNLGRKVLPARAKFIIKTAMHHGRSWIPLNSPRQRSLEKPTVATLPNQLHEKFSQVYEHNLFAGRKSRSGEGSDLDQTRIIRQELPRVVKEYSIKTFLDAPCGDWFWMRETDLGVEKYIGADIVEAMIAKHQRDFSNQSREFHCLNLASDALPQVDLIFCRDCLVHLNFADAKKILLNFKRSGSKYLLVTTFVDRKNNSDLVGKHAFWRTLNMQLPPFSFPEPLLTINEGCTEDAGNYTDKCLGLWRLDDIKI